MSLTMASILRKRNQSLFRKYNDAQGNLAATYAELLKVVVEITTTYHKRVRSKSLSNLVTQGQTNIMQQARRLMLRILISSLEKRSTLSSIIVIKSPTLSGHASLSALFALKV